MIEIVDNFISEYEAKKLYEILWESDFYLMGTENSNIDKNSRKWSMSRFINDGDKNISFYDQLKERVEKLDLLGSNYSCNRMIANAYKYSDVLSLHLDGIENGYDNKTALLYGNDKWEINWGSETIFADRLGPDAEIIKSVIPKPGRLVVFDSDIPHTGRNPSSIFPNYRYSVVFNLQLKFPKKSLL